MNSKNNKTQTNDWSASSRTRIATSPVTRSVNSKARDDDELRAAWAAAVRLDDKEIERKRQEKLIQELTFREKQKVTICKPNIVERSDAGGQDDLVIVQSASGKQGDSERDDDDFVLV